MEQSQMTALPVASAAPRPDGAFLHFLKELPTWCVLSGLVCIFLAVWQISHDDFIPRIIDGLIGGILTSLMAGRPRSGSPTINANKIETGDVGVPTDGVVPDNDRSDTSTEKE